MRKSMRISLLATAIVFAASLGLARESRAALVEECTCEPEAGCTLCHECHYHGAWMHCCWACGGANCQGCPVE